MSCQGVALMCHVADVSCPQSGVLIVESRMYVGLLCLHTAYQALSYRAMLKQVITDTNTS